MTNPPESKFDTSKWHRALSNALTSADSVLSNTIGEPSMTVRMYKLPPQSTKTEVGCDLTVTVKHRFHGTSSY